MEFKDYYKTLGIDRKAPPGEIKKAFRQLARKYHPDISKEAGAEAKFKEINEANDVLGDAEKRKAYDEFGADWQQGQQFKPPPDWNKNHHFRQRAQQNSDASGFADSGFSDFFEELFRGRGQQAGRAQQRGGDFKSRGQDEHARITVNLRDAFGGETRQLSLRVPEADASGAVMMRDKVLNLKIPKGLVAGQIIRLRQQGSPGIGGGESGDLYLEIEFAPDKLYRVEGKDLFIDLPVAPWEAALGASVKVPTPTGFIMLNIPPDSRQGRELRVKGKGIPAADPGDLLVRLALVLPRGDTAKAKELYKTMAHEMAFDPRAGMEA